MTNDNVDIWRSLFHEYYEYPDSDLLLNAPKDGDCFAYVSNSYLNGFINYVKIIGAFALRRYNRDEKYDYRSEIEKIKNEPHCNFSKLIKDDVVVIAKGANSHWFFWSDQDCSDCVIARTEIYYDDNVFLDIMKKHFDTLFGPVEEIPVEYIKGWLTF